MKIKSNTRIRFAVTLALCGLLASTAAAQDLPTGDELLEQCIEAMGGQDKFDELESSRTVAHAIMAGMGEMDMTLYWAKGGKVLIKQQIPQMGEMKMGFDGEVAWQYMAGSYQLLEGPMAEQIKEQAGINMLAAGLKKQFKSLRTVDKTEFDGRDCYRVIAVNEDGEEGTVYFDVETKLIGGMENEAEGPDGPMEVVMRFRDYKEIDGIQVVSQMVIDQMGMEIEVEFTEVEFNKVHDSIFDLPAEVKKLVGEAGDDGG